MMIRNEGAFLLLLSLAMDAEVARTLGISHLDDPAPHISTKEDVLLMIQLTDVIVRCDYTPALFYASAFH